MNIVSNSQDKQVFCRFYLRLFESQLRRYKIDLKYIHNFIPKCPFKKITTINNASISVNSQFENGFDGQIGTQK